MLRSTVHAEIIHFTGKGSYFMTTESVEYSKGMAKTEAIRDISRQAYMHVKGDTKTIDSMLDIDEIVGDTESIMHILNVKYHLKAEGDNCNVQAIVDAEIDTEELDKLFKRDKRY